MDVTDRASVGGVDGSPDARRRRRAGEQRGRRRHETAWTTEQDWSSVLDVASTARGASLRRSRGG
jgi:hypothetical protein